MASMTCSSSSSSPGDDSSKDQERPDPEFIRELVSSINAYILEFLSDSESWKALKSQCTSKLDIQKQEFFEFSEQSILSNLYWGIVSIEAAAQGRWPEEKTNHLANAERMLQVPALLDEHGKTAGIQNQLLICYSYFYLSVVRKLQNDEWQVAQHFLQAMVVCPRLVLEELAPQLSGALFPWSTVCKKQVTRGKEILLDDSCTYSNEDIVDEVIRKIAKKYKPWVMYYQVMKYGDTPQWQCSSGRASFPDDESQYFLHVVKSSCDHTIATEQGHCLQACDNRVHPLDPQECILDDGTEDASISDRVEGFQYFSHALEYLDQVPKLKDEKENFGKSTSLRYLWEVLLESQSDTLSTTLSSRYSSYLGEGDLENGVLLVDQLNVEATRCSMRVPREVEDDPQPELFDQKLQAACSTMERMSTTMISLHSPQESMQKEACAVNEQLFQKGVNDLFSCRFLKSISDLDLRALELNGKSLDTVWDGNIEGNLSQRLSRTHIVPVNDSIAPTALQNFMPTQTDHPKKSTKDKRKAHSQRYINELCLGSAKVSRTESMEILERSISRLRFLEGLTTCEEDYASEITTIYEMLNNKRGVKYTMLKDVILDQLLVAISNSKEERVIRASMSILSTIISKNKSAIEEIKKKGLRLHDLATALKRNVHEAAILIYMINPPPKEMKTLELLPALAEVLCTSSAYEQKPESVLLTPPAASLMIIEVLVTAFDCATNNMHLAAINSPRVLSGLLNVADSRNLEEYISLANILVKCMQFDGQGRKYIAEFIPVGPFKRLLQSNDRRAKFAALEFFHEILQMPRSSSFKLLQRILQEGSGGIIQTVMQCVQDLQSDYQLLAANLLIQLDTLASTENSGGKSGFTEEAMNIILHSIISEEGSTIQQLSTFMLANIGGTYSWTGEPYTMAWLIKKAGLTSSYHRNMVKNIDWMDQCLQDAGIDSWCSKISKGIMDIGKPIFYALEKGLRSKIKRISRDSLIAIAWIGCEISKYPHNLRYNACEILLNGIEKFLHPGFELEERLLACLCIYNYASGRGMHKLCHFSEGVRESLRRFSNVTWMAEELHRVADYYVPDKSVWDVNQQSATLVWDMKEHKKAVTCFSLLEAGDCLLSGSDDKTIRVWQVVEKKLECTEVITMKEPIRKLETQGQMIFIINQGLGMKVLDSSRKVKDICKSKRVKCMSAYQGKIYIGCQDSSIQELATVNNKERQIRAATKSWRMQHKPINSIVVYKDWMYSASSTVEGSKVQKWRTQCKPQMSIPAEKGRNVLAMEVVEDFIYLNCSSSTSTLQIWLRGTEQKVGRISAGSRITSLLTANDIVLCGTEKGLIKGWIPL
ncbi:hypothetical protein Tsubulata_016280 [Turnera subulata]|uniref:E3 ubiquitin-protein ligase LIN-1 n=1 Tax=Turnera subulata TaxID=218843 RepID=A0A9Q0FP82_9ROSI|nr:hypothetical protein Tsubulata_016280 [Turnera subulata]